MEIDPVRGKQERLKLNLTHKFMFCGDINLLGENEYSKEKHKICLLLVKKFCLEVNGVKVSVYVTLSEYRTVSQYEDS